MPTAAKLVAAVIFALCGYIVADLVRLQLPNEVAPDWLFKVCIGVPLVIGWRVMGKLVGTNYGVSLNNGLYGIVLCTISCTFIFSVGLMIKKSRRLVYDGPMEALVDVFALMLEYGLLLLDPYVLATLLIGGFIAGISAEWAHRKFG